MPDIEVSIDPTGIGGRPNAVTTVVVFGPADKRRTVKFRTTDIEDSFDLAEIAPATAGQNWRIMALIAMSLVWIDNAPAEPLGSPPQRKHILSRLRKLGDDGFAAIVEVQSKSEAADADAPLADPIDPEAAHKASVGN